MVLNSGNDFLVLLGLKVRGAPELISDKVSLTGSKAAAFWMLCAAFLLGVETARAHERERSCLSSKDTSSPLRLPSD